MDYLNDLNEAQRKAVINVDGPSLVIAGAGSGKTRVLTSRVTHLIKKGAPADTILALTFTNKAAREMKERIIQIAGFEATRYLWMGTFHSMFARILRVEAASLGYPKDFTIYDTQDSRNLVKTIIKELELDDKIYKVAEIWRRISSAKNNLITAKIYSSNHEIIEQDKRHRKERIQDIFKIYSSRCYRSGAMDFDDILLNINVLFRDFKDILSKYQKQFHYVLVDEYQDTNFAQYLIVKSLSEKHRNLFVVGDDAQSIYSFRGARIENILNFKNDYPDYKLYKLEQNYRSTRNIVDAANSLISRNTGQIPKKIFSKNEPGSKIEIIRAKTDIEEGFLTSSSIFDTALRRQLKYSDFAILYRTNAQSRIFEAALRKRNIPYRVYGSLSFYQRKEIKDMLAYCRFVINPNDDEALKRIINYPARGIGKTSMLRVEKCANEQDLSMWEVVIEPESFETGLNRGAKGKLKIFSSLIESFAMDLEKSDAYDLAFRIATETGILKELYNSDSPEELSKYENIQELLNGIREFVSGQEEEGGFAGLGEFLQDVALLTDADTNLKDDRNKVSVMTVHAAKGLEFQCVYIAGMEEELFPSVMSSASLKELEEERRLFYVALTRAETEVIISYTETRYRWGVMNYCKPSRFLKEIEDKYLEWPKGYMANGITNQIDRSSANSVPSWRKPKTTISSPAQVVPSGGKKWIKLGQAEKAHKIDEDFKASDPEKIQAGMEVEHIRFGKGKVLNVESSGTNRKATVFFNSHGQKQLLLKFAKLKLVKQF
ncbi:MAG: 3'-5' exonuclease [Bacteroidota bacterium]|nr:3'-5' exonuclease [Bacteroidota bacterium]